MKEEEIELSKEEIYELFVNQSKNVRYLGKIKRTLIKELNFALKNDDEHILKMKTLQLALLYSAWSESQFIQMLYTPNGLSSDEINQILKIKKKKGIVSGWKKLLELGMKKVSNSKSTNTIPNSKQFLNSLIEKYIEGPSIIRNKIAHGQWIVALNGKNTGVNQGISDNLEYLDFVEVDRNFEIHNYLSSVFRDLLQSPQKGFFKNYWSHLSELKTFIQDSKDWSLLSKKSQLAKKARV